MAERGFKSTPTRTSAGRPLLSAPYQPSIQGTACGALHLAWIEPRYTAGVGRSGAESNTGSTPPGTGEEVRDLLQLRPDAAVVVTAPQWISGAAARKVVVMASEYRLPLLGFVENQQNGAIGEAGHRLAAQYGLPLLAQIPWSIDIPTSMDEHVPLDHQPFLPVAQALTAQIFPPAGLKRPPTSEEEEPLRRAEAWVASK